MKKTILILFAVLSLCTVTDGKTLKGSKFDFVCRDIQFKNPFVDVDKEITSPVRCRYIHGGFDDGTLFSFYFPLKKEDYTGRFFQYITPFPDSETSAQAMPAEYPSYTASSTEHISWRRTRAGSLISMIPQAEGTHRSEHIAPTRLARNSQGISQN